ncbi:MAG: fused MFS/spermidine synthase [Actinomycetota bacterium]
MPLMRILYASAVFLGAFLLFLVEPIVGKRLLPLLGGSSAVWITCLVFFQSALLVGYVAAHWLATRLRPRAQAMAYSSFLLLGLGQGVFGLSPRLHASTFHPIVSVFVLLAALIGFPFVALAATNPLLQSWYVRDCESRAGEGQHIRPYRLFAVSNFGSLLALLIYPWLVEPNLTLREQSALWLAGLLMFALSCAGIIWRIRNSSGTGREEQSASGGSADSPALADRILWLLLPACASLLLCAVTSHLTQNIAAIPLLWILPLGAYLLSFIWAFSGARLYPRRTMLCVFVAALAAVSYELWDKQFVPAGKRLLLPMPWTIVLFCAILLLLCLVCHAELYRLRPGPRHLTSFYLSIAAGGALGAVFVGVVAPLVFSANYELSCGLLMTVAVVLLATWRLGVIWRLLWPAGFLAMATLAVLHARADSKDTIVQLRNFYGTLRVTQHFDPPEGSYTRTLIHGTILHGEQTFTDKLRRAPTTYYGHKSGAGLALDLCCGTSPRRVGVIGLGAGTLAAYGRKGDVFRFYDINPLVERIANNLFTYLRESDAKIEIVTGDARLSLAAEPQQHYDVLLVDAFSGDAIPVHLLTRQAMELYLRHLKPGGILAFHVTNRYLDLSPEVERLAEHAGLQAALISSDEDDDAGVYGADWVLVTANHEFLKEIAVSAIPIRTIPGLRPWADDFNSLLPLLRKEEIKWDEP